MKRNLPRLLFASIALWVLHCTSAEQTAFAADSFPDPIPEVKTHEITFTPAKEPTPPFRYRLATEISESTSGNAATYYLRALVMLKERSRKTIEQNEREAELQEMPLKDLPLDELTTIVENNLPIFGELDFATKCGHCDWGVRFEDHRGPLVIEALLPEFQSMRDLARLLRFKARLEIAEKKYDEAIGTLKQMFQMSRNLSRAPNLICNLIAVAVHSLTNDTVMDLIASEGAPNLYWGLQSLPNPLVDFHDAIELESTMALRLFPFLKDADSDQRTPEEWHRLLSGVVTSLEGYGSIPASQQASKGLIVAAMLMKAYPIAKRELIASGYDAEKVEKMPTAQVIAIHARDCYIRFNGEYRKWMIVPYPQGYVRMVKVSQKLMREGYIGENPNVPSDRDPLLINSQLGYAANQILAANNRQAFMAASLIVIEAIRMHAAENGGELPASLDEITVVPVPNDPSTGRPFLYRVVGGKAELLVVPSDGNASYSGRHFVLEVK